MKEKVERLDIKETILSNIPYSIFVFLLIVFVLRFAKMIDTFDSNELRLMGIIIWAFSSIKILSWIGDPLIVYKTKKGKLVIR